MFLDFRFSNKKSLDTRLLLILIMACKQGIGVKFAKSLPPPNVPDVRKSATAARSVRPMTGNATSKFVDADSTCRPAVFS